MHSVLYVDDEPVLLELTKLYIENSGDISVDTAESADEAIKILKDRSYDAVVSDYMMPGMDGIELLKELRRSGNEVPFIIFTGRGREDIVIEAFESGADFYIQKGGDARAQFAELVHKIKQAVSRHEAEKALAESEEKFRNIVELSPDFILQSDTTGTAVYASPSALDILGFEPEEIIGKRFDEFMEPEDIRKVEEGLALLHSGAGTQNYNMRIHRKDGTYAELEISAVPLRSKRYNGIQIIGRDLSSRRRAEEEIRSRDELYRSLAETVPGMIYIVDPEGTVLFVNKNAASGFKSTPEEITGKTLFDLYPEDLAGGHMEAIHAVISSGKPYYREMVECLPAGDFWISVSLSPLRDAEGRINGVLGVSYDITGRKHTENALEIANRKLGLLSKITRHDLRNKITAILGYCELARDETENDNILQLLGKQETSLDEMTNIINFLKKYETDDSDPARWINLQDEVSNYMSAIETVGVAMNFELKGLEIFSDVIFVRIFSDLINNSIMHGRNVSGIKIGWEESDDFIKITYEDNGCGVPADKKEKIFRKGFGEGTGLGLYYIRAILNVIGMSISEIGVEGEGALFEIRVPVDLCRFPGRD